MSLLKLIAKIDKSRKTTKFLKEETSKILRYSFTNDEDEPLEDAVINKAVALQMGAKMVKSKKYRLILIESLSINEIKALGYISFEEAIDELANNELLFISTFNIEDEFITKEEKDDRANFELISAVHGNITKNNAFPHHYQKSLKSIISKKLFNHVNPIILASMPTGAGKTVLALETMVDLFRAFEDLKQKKLNLLWIVDSKELSEQSLQSFKKMWIQKGDHNIIFQRFWEKFDKLEDFSSDSSITFATFDLITARLSDQYVKSLLSDCDLLIIDEAHSSNASTFREVFNTYINFNSNHKILGLTATPYRTDDTNIDSLRGMFTELLLLKDSDDNHVESPIKYLRENEYLANINFKLLNSDLLNIKNASYYRSLHDDVLNECKLIIEEKKNTIIFAESKSHAIALSIFLLQNGIKNGLIVGETSSARRKDLLANFENKDDNLRVLVNHQILSTGIDVPGLNSIMILANIESPTLALQTLGRAMRGKKNGGNKENTIYLTKFNFNKLSEFELIETLILTKTK